MIKDVEPELVLQSLGQFFPLGGPGILTYSNQELRALARLFGR